jgi:hypothetical protein
MRWATTWMCIGIGGLAGCSPAFDWREVRPEASDVLAMFPCKPERAERDVPLGDRRVRMRLLSCSVDGTMFALSGSDVGDPAQVAGALSALRATAAANVGAPAASGVAFNVPGATPNAQAGRMQLDGRRPDGQPLVAHAAFFARGTAVWQATVMGRAPSGEAIETFFAGLQAGR